MQMISSPFALDDFIHKLHDLLGSDPPNAR